MRKIIPYTLKIPRMFAAHHENNIVAPRGELTTPKPVRACPQKEEGRKRGKSAGSRQARNPSWHHLSATLNTRWFIHEDSLTAITLIRLINGCSRGEMGQRTYTENEREKEKERQKERERESCNVIQTDDISLRLTLPRLLLPLTFRFSSFASKEAVLEKSVLRKKGASKRGEDKRKFLHFLVASSFMSSHSRDQFYIEKYRNTFIIIIIIQIFLIFLL